MIETDKKSEEEPALVKERKRIARALHDELAQHLTALSLHAHAISIVSKNEEVLMHTHQIDDLIANSRIDIKNLIWDLTDKNSCSSLSLKINRLLTYWKDVDDKILQNIEIQGSLDQLPDPVSHICYSIVQEAVTNIYRHAKASRFKLSFNCSHDSLHIHIEDNGVGFDNTAASDSNGLDGIHARLEQVGGTCLIDSSHDQGTHLFVSIPLSDGGVIWKQS